MNQQDYASVIQALRSAEIDFRDLSRGQPPQLDTEEYYTRRAEQMVQVADWLAARAGKETKT